MSKKQVKPLINIEFLDRTRNPLFEYKCGLYSLFDRVKFYEGVDLILAIEKVDDKIIRGEDISSIKGKIDECIELEKKSMAYGYAKTVKNLGPRKREEYQKYVKDGSFNWRTEKYMFDSETKVSEVMFLDNKMPFTKREFKYRDDDFSFEVISSTVHIGKPNLLGYLGTVEVQYENHENVGKVIDRARKKYKSKE